MTEIEVAQLILNLDNNIYGLFNILIIDKICCTEHNNYFKNKLITVLIPPYPYSILYSPDTIIMLLCYCIINYATVIEGDAMIKHFAENKLLYDNLLEFHFRPRGSHTKSAIIN
jgi:hypothetical protein